MATNLALDDSLVEEAKSLGEHRTKRAAVTDALVEYVNRRKRRRILELRGKLDWEPEYDDTAGRRRR